MIDGNMSITCGCGQVVLNVQGAPIVSAECLCIDCQKAGEFLQGLPGAPEILDDNAATRFVLYRKDKVWCESGQSCLREHRLSTHSKTRRVVATCCNTPIFLEFTHGHWLSIYGGLWPVGTLPELEIRTMTRDRPKGVEFSDDVPSPNTHTASFFAKLFGAWVAMRFRSPKVDYVSGKIDA